MPLCLLSLNYWWFRNENLNQVTYGASKNPGATFLVVQPSSQQLIFSVHALTVYSSNF